VAATDMAGTVSRSGREQGRRSRYDPGGALRKQRRGEELTEQEREAIGRWQQMAVWRKGVAIGAFAVGTFGLGFTLGGLVFGRWRKA
jgi:hypothetical protein